MIGFYIIFSVNVGLRVSAKAEHIDHISPGFISIFKYLN